MRGCIVVFNEMGEEKGEIGRRDNLRAVRIASHERGEWRGLEDSG